MYKLKRKIPKVVIWLALFVGLLTTVQIIRLGLLYRQIGTYKNYWNLQNTEPPKPNSLTYLALGDSTAQGIGASSPTKGYVGLIAKALEQKTGRPVRIINLSVSGAKVADCMRDQIPKLEKYNADFITIEIGANDLGAYDQANFRSNMEKLISKLPEGTVISDMPYFGGGRKRNLEKNAISASAIIQELASSRGLKVAQLHKVTKDNDNLLTMSSDLFHPSNRGYRNWYLAFESVMFK